MRRSSRGQLYRTAGQVSSTDATGDPRPKIRLSLPGPVHGPAAARDARTRELRERTLAGSGWGTAKIRPKCAIATLKRARGRRIGDLPRMPFLSRKLGDLLRRVRTAARRRSAGLASENRTSVLRRLPRARESPGTSLDRHNVPSCRLRRALIVAGARAIAGFGRILAVPEVLKARRNLGGNSMVGRNAADNESLLQARSGVAVATAAHARVCCTLITSRRSF
jgi:hypothetical protein